MTNLITCLFTLYPPNSPYFTQGSQRENEFVEGFRRFRKIYDELLSKEFSVLLVENTVSSVEEVPQAIRNEWSDDWNFIATESNRYGGSNKGAGIVENYLLLKQGGILDDYDWIIHFEPRLSLNDGSFFETFIKSPMNQFTPATEGQYFTGLFSLESDALGEFINQISLEEMTMKRINLENIIYHFMVTKPKRELDKVSCTWHDAYTKKSYEF